MGWKSRICLAVSGIAFVSSIAIGQADYAEIKDPRLHQLINDIANKTPLYRVKKNLRQDDVARKITDRKWTPLCFAAAHCNLPATMLLLKMGASPNVPLAKGKTMLMLAARYGDDGVARVLMRAGADLNAKDDLGFSAFTYAAMQHRYPYKDGYSGIIEDLLDRHAKSTPIERAAALSLLPVQYNWGGNYKEDAKGNLTKIGYFNDPNLVHIRKVMARLFALGANFNERIKAKNDFDFEREDGEFGIDRTGHPIIFACRSGDLAMLKMATRFTPGWQKWTDDGYNGRISLVELARTYQNFHIVRFLKRKGLK